jgi:hypothetical protein
VQRRYHVASKLFHGFRPLHQQRDHRPWNELFHSGD